MRARTKGRTLTDTFYDTRGLVARTNSAYYNDQPMPEKVLFAPNDAQIPNQTVNSYDRVARKTKETYEKLNTPQWSTTTEYLGDAVTVTPSAGGTPTTTLFDAKGNTTEVRQYLNGTASGAYNATTTAYAKSGDVASTTDAVRNVWTNTYDVAGNQVTNADPDKGTGTFTYNVLGQVTTSTDARGGEAGARRSLAGWS